MSVEELKHPGINLGETDPESHAEAEEIVFGFWVFMMSDVIIFALLFAVFGTMITATAGGPGGHELFDVKSAFEETMVLLVSSFTFGMASLAMKYGEDGKVGWLVLWLAITLVLGLSFIGLELRDFVQLIDKGDGPDRSGFLSAYFALVSTHGIHVTAGCVWIVVMIIQSFAFGITRDVKTRILRLGLFWHFLDIIWVTIFSFVYLRGIV